MLRNLPKVTQLVQIIHFQIWWNSKLLWVEGSLRITSKSPRELAKELEIPERFLPYHQSLL